MTLERLQALLRAAPLVASVQASEGSPVDDPTTLLRLARASLDQGVAVLRLQGVENIGVIREATGAPVIGLIKRAYSGSEVYITPTQDEVRSLLDLGCEVIALDGTARPRPGGEALRDLVEAIHRGGALAMADCDSVESLAHAEEAGADLFGTTLVGYTGARETTPGPDMELLRAFCLRAPGRVMAEGRFSEPWQAAAAIRAGAVGVVIGGALNDPVKQTRAFLSACTPYEGPVGAVDIGGTWIRFAVEQDGRLSQIERCPLQAAPEDRLDWIRGRVAAHGIERLGVSTGGTVHRNRVTEAKAIIPGHVGSDFSDLAPHVVALNDGLCTAWGHACHPQFAGLDVATLALGTGVGCGYVRRGRLLMGSQGEYPRLNDLPTAQGACYEDLLGGAALTSEPSDEARERAQFALESAVEILRALLFPDVIVVCGGVGLSDWLRLPDGVVRSPFGQDAGLMGAAALARYPAP